VARSAQLYTEGALEAKDHQAPAQGILGIGGLLAIILQPEGHPKTSFNKDGSVRRRQAGSKSERGRAMGRQNCGVPI
jgi:hypothetical protein